MQVVRFNECGHIFFNCRHFPIDAIKYPSGNDKHNFPIIVSMLDRKIIRSDIVFYISRNFVPYFVISHILPLNCHFSRYASTVTETYLNTFLYVNIFFISSTEIYAESDCAIELPLTTRLASLLAYKIYAVLLMIVLVSFAEFVPHA